MMDSSEPTTQFHNKFPQWILQISSRISNKTRQERPIPRKNRKKIRRSESENKQREIERNWRLASAKPRGGVVSTHEGYTGTLDCAPEEHQLSHPLNLHGSSLNKTRSIQWRLSITQIWVNEKGSSQTQAPMDVNQRWRRKREEEIRRMQAKEEGRDWVEREGFDLLRE